jgi:hypothetical protein
MIDVFGKQWEPGSILILSVDSKTNVAVAIFQRHPVTWHLGSLLIVCSTWHFRTMEMSSVS